MDSCTTVQRGICSHSLLLHAVAIYLVCSTLSAQRIVSCPVSDTWWQPQLTNIVTCWEKTAQLPLPFEHASARMWIDWILGTSSCDGLGLHLWLLFNGPSFSRRWLWGLSSFRLIHRLRPWGLRLIHRGPIRRWGVCGVHLRRALCLSLTSTADRCTKLDQDSLCNVKVDAVPCLLR